MARKKSQPLKVICHLSTNGRDGPYKRIEECSEEELQMFVDKSCEKISEYLSMYYSAHTEEYLELCKKVTA